MLGRPPEEPAIRFSRFVEPAADGCVVWQGVKNWQGYGKFYFRGRQEPAHRAAWMLAHGDIPHGMLVLHRCDNPSCVNVEHLYLGGHVENRRDCFERKRANLRVKCSLEDVARARDLYRGGMSQAAIGRMIGMSQPQVSRYVRDEGRKDY